MYQRVECYCLSFIKRLFIQTLLYSLVNAAKGHFVHERPMHLVRSFWFAKLISNSFHCQSFNDNNLNLKSLTLLQFQSFWAPGYHDRRFETSFTQNSELSALSTAGSNGIFKRKIALFHEISVRNVIIIS